MDRGDAPDPGEHVDTITQSGFWVPPAGVTSVDLFLVGGGGGAVNGGGGGGYTQTYLDVPVTPGQPYSITIGQGGAGARQVQTSAIAAQDGGYTRFGDNSAYQAEGGRGAFNSQDFAIREGGDGGSGGGASGSSNTVVGGGGSDGGDGGSGDRGNGGLGQGSSTRAFGDMGGELYGGGGGGGISMGSPGTGGPGGGGDGVAGSSTPPNPGEDGRGGGGGGCAGIGGTQTHPGGRGGHGVALIRYRTSASPAPEVSSIWVGHIE